MRREKPLCGAGVAGLDLSLDLWFTVSISTLSSHPRFDKHIELNCVLISKLSSHPRFDKQIECALAFR